MWISIQSRMLPRTTEENSSYWVEKCSTPNGLPTKRFYAFDAGSEILDPSVLQEGTPVTLVGEVTGMMSGTIGESQYQYPTVRIKDLTKWDKREVRYWPRYYPYYGGYYWHGFRPFGFYW
jgi:starvation-inducible outer membrane lipoprotein